MILSLAQTSSIKRSPFRRIPIVLFAATFAASIPLAAKAYVQRPFIPKTAGTMAFFSANSSSQPEPQDSNTTFSVNTRRLESPSAERNKGPIWEVLSTKVFPRLEQNPSRRLTIMETAAGAGVHTEYFATKLLEKFTVDRTESPFVWYASDPSQDSLLSILARTKEQNLGAVIAAPKILTLGASGINQEESSKDALPVEDNFDLILSINMIHISPWEATLGLMKVAGQRLRKPSDTDDGGYLYCYGPYKIDGTSVPSNESFDRSLKSRNSDWGVRELEEVVNAAENEGLELVEKVDMPANNMSLIFRRIRTSTEVA